MLMNHVLVPVADEADARETAGALSEFIFAREEAMPDSVVSTAASVQPDGGKFRVMVPLANPAHERGLMALASAVANRRNGSVHAVHIVTVPDQTSLEYAADHLDEFEERYHSILDDARLDAEELEVPFESHTIVSHRSFEEVFDAARSHDADLVVMGWGRNSHGSPGRVESAMDDLVKDLPCDFLVFKDRGFDPSRILLPTAGGPDSALSAQTARDLQATFGSEVSLLHVSDDVAAGEAFLEEWAEEHDLADADRIVASGDIEDAIATAAEDATLVLAGASERAPDAAGAADLGLMDDIDCSVLLAERAHHRGLWARIFGR
ncbi:MAG: universal stress protein [Halobacteriales archaeon]|nr:universal stress protein [Halobacteriales archaeon]